MKTLHLFFAALAMVALAACNGKKATTENGREPAELSGAGATFPLPFYNMAFEEFFKVNGDQVSYGGIGSGGGVRNLKDQIVDFAGSDAYLTDEEMSAMQPVVHVPTCMGAVVMAYNLPGIQQLNLAGDVIASIFAGDITKWNDTRIAAINPDVQLPDQKIIPVYRSDGSGTTFNFTDYLAKADEGWKTRFGAAKSVNFPVGQAAKGNPGVASIVNQTPYTLGYVGSEYAFAQKLSYAAIRNKRGEFVNPTTESISAAAAGDIPQDTRCTIADADADGAYPISCFTWLIVYKEQNYAKRSKEQAEATVALLNYMLTDEVQKSTATVHYAPLPQKAIELSRKNISEITYDGQAIAPLKAQ